MFTPSPVQPTKLKYRLVRVSTDGVSEFVDSAYSSEQAVDLARLDRARMRDHHTISRLAKHTVFAPSGKVHLNIEVPK